MSKHVRVLVVDDSSFYRRRICSSLKESPQIEVVGEAENGEEALHLVKTLSPDLITMDVAMPVMDGIAAVRRIMAERPTRIIMFSALTQDGAKATLEALEAGAVDFLPKISSNEHMGSSAAQLRERVLGVASAETPSDAGASFQRASTGARRAEAGMERSVRGAAHTGNIRLLVIGASTGGPVAVQQVLSSLPAGFPVPVLVVIHMPGAFTTTYAERLNEQTGLHVSEAQDGASLLPGSVLVAPGGYQTTVVNEGDELSVRVAEGGVDQLYHPSVDLTLESVAQSVGADALGVIMTGMGSDGATGARSLTRAGGRIWAQDAESCVVYGMPRAVVEAGLAERVMPVGDMAAQLAQGI